MGASLFAGTSVQAKDASLVAELDPTPELSTCECRASPTTWASVSLGVFVCMDCAQVHRNLGAHISKVPAHRVPGAVGGEEASHLLSPQS